METLKLEIDEYNCIGTREASGLYAPFRGVIDDEGQFVFKVGGRPAELENFYGRMRVKDETPLPGLAQGYWRPVIDIRTGKILNWTEGVRARIYYKVVDACKWVIRNANGKKQYSGRGYVPDTLAPDGNGYGDYISMNIG